MNTDKLKSLTIDHGGTCNLKIGSIPVEGLFRYIDEFPVKIEKKNDTTTISFISESDPKYKFTVYLRNFSEVIQNNPLVYYIVMRSRPALFKETEVMGDNKWGQEDYSILNKDTDYIQGLVYPITLVFRIEFADYFENFDVFIDYTKCEVKSLDIYDIKWSEYPLPDYDQILSNANTWELKYMVLVLLTNYQMALNDLTLDNINLMNLYDDSVAVLEEIYYNYENFSRELFLKRLEEFNPSNKLKSNNENHIFVRKARFTPSAIIFEPPEIDVSNRVARKFNFPDFYLRISIEDENFEKRIWSNCPSLLNKFKNLLNRLYVVGRYYEFLGFSNSQMKNHSCWMVARDLGKTADEIRSVLGDFSRCKNNSKYASRLGLCFSGTYKTLEMKRVTIPDIERDGYCFTDGIGRISFECMENAKEKLGIPHTNIVTALQVRIGGCKGVLALNKDCDEIEVRPSMDKFGSSESTLEVCSVSAYRQGYLNRQIILLLNGRGVQEQVFLDLQENMIKEIQMMLEDEAEASKLLIREKDPIIMGLKYMLRNNVKINDEPYLHRMLTAIYQNKVLDIKKKARILAPMSLILMGIVDEHAVLEYGEVFIYPSVDSPDPITGPVVIAKNPCLHPGDIRVLNAVDKPELYYLKDVLVFPQKGHRPHPNECSGSDLDGDMYFITWNPDLIPVIKNEDPMDYTPPPEKQEIPSIQGVIEFFIHYMESENLGNIANTHLAQADKNGIFNENVIKLAELHSKAVDYPKTGVPAIIPQSCRVKSWPDYMEKHEKISYKSEHVIGKLYRNIISKDIKTFIPLADDRYLFKGYREHVFEAKVLYDQYAKELKKLMRQYDTPNEFLLLSFQPGDKLGKKSKLDNKLKMQNFIKDLINDTLAAFNEVANTIQEKKLLASACYWVSYSMEKKKNKFITKFLSFPWIFYEYLLAN
jgi:RNA-dependent RNA polymerase